MTNTPDFIKNNKNLYKCLIGVSLPLSFLIVGCGQEPISDNSAELTAFRGQVDAFCISIAECDANINAIDTSNEDYKSVMLGELDGLKADFKEFAAIDFPSDYDYLENLADEASSYMDTAVDNYHDAFENDLSKEAFESKYSYASENYSRAYKRIQVIITFLNGEISEDVTMTNWYKLAIESALILEHVFIFYD